MSEPKRYDLRWHEEYRDFYVDEADDGEWVRATDYDQLRTERDEWKARCLTSEASEEDAQQAAVRLKTERDEAIAQAEKLAEALELYADKRNWRRAYDGQGHLNVFQADTNGPYTALDALDAYRNRPQVSQDVDTSIKESTISDTKVAPEATILQEKDTHFACNWEYGPHREPMRPEWKSGCGKIHPKMLSEDWHDLCPYCGRPVSVPGAMEEAE